MRSSSPKTAINKIMNKDDPDIRLKLKCPYVTCKNPECKVSWHHPCQLTKNGSQGFVSKLRPMAFVIGAAEIVVGVTFLIIVVFYSKSYDELFGIKESKVISLLVFYGLVALVVTGIMLSIALVFNIRRILWYYILLSSILSVHTFALAVIKIHFALLVLEIDTNELKLDKPQYILNNGCAFGILTLLGSVVHFMGNVTVFSYHNLKYINPVLFETQS